MNTNGNQAARFRPRNNHNNKKFDDRIEPLYILPVEQLPVMEKETVVTQYPNGTIVTVITEVVYDNFEGKQIHDLMLITWGLILNVLGLNISWPRLLHDYSYLSKFCV